MNDTKDPTAVFCVDAAYVAETMERSGTRPMPTIGEIFEITERLRSAWESSGLQSAIDERICQTAEVVRSERAEGRAPVHGRSAFRTNALALATAIDRTLSALAEEPENTRALTRNLTNLRENAENALESGTITVDTELAHYAVEGALLRADSSSDEDLMKTYSRFYDELALAAGDDLRRVRIESFALEAGTNLDLLADWLNRRAETGDDYESALAKSLRLIACTESEALYQEVRDSVRKYYENGWEGYRRALTRALDEFFNPGSHDESDYIQMMNGRARRILTLGPSEHADDCDCAGAERS